jgi:molecular chaperone DnaJ
MSKQDFYKTLGVERGATDAEIKKAFRSKARDMHPDKNKDDPKAAEKFKTVNEAHDVLKDSEKRAAYDQFGHAAFEGGMGASAGARGAQQGGEFGHGFADVFEDLFGDFMGGRGRSASGGGGRARGSDMRYNLKISLEDAFLGKETSISVPGSVACDGCKGSGAEGGAEPVTCPTCAGRGQVRAQQGFFTIERTCPTCAGRGQTIKNPCHKCSGQGRVAKNRTLSVRIPEGVENGTRIRLAGEGEAGARGGPPGDLYIFLEMADHALFERDALDLFCRIPVPMTTAALGGEIEAPTIDGGRSRVKIPAGSQSGKQLRLRAKGMPQLRGGRFGDLYLELLVETPVNLTSHQKELLQMFEAASEENSPESEDFFSRVKGFWDGMTG